MDHNEFLADPFIAGGNTQAPDADFSAEALERYGRQVMIPEIGVSGQRRIRKARVFICGAGGLGSPAAICLALAGVGAITLADPDRVALGNLNRQMLHGEGDIGRYKVDSAKETLSRLNASVTLNTLKVKVSGENALEILRGHDVVIDALDNMETRYTLNQAALNLRIPFVHGAVSGFEGRLMTVLPGKSTCLRCLYRGPVERPEATPVVGTTSTVIGSLQAAEAIKYIAGVGELVIDRMLVYDGLKAAWQQFKVHRNPGCDHCAGLQEKKDGSR